MTYHVVFDISERIPQAIIGIAAILPFAFIMLSLVFARPRMVARHYAWVFVALAAVEWAGFNTLDVGGPYGLGFGLGVGAILAVSAALLRTKEPEEPFDDLPHGPRRGNVGLTIGAAMLCLVSIEGIQQLPAVALRQGLINGDAAMTTGTVTGTFNSSWGYEEFVVNGHLFSFSNDPSSIGFHQTTANGGPIHNGIEVRIWWIGDAIVRLEVRS